MAMKIISFVDYQQVKKKGKENRKNTRHLDKNTGARKGTYGQQGYMSFKSMSLARVC